MEIVEENIVIDSEYLDNKVVLTLEEKKEINPIVEIYGTKENHVGILLSLYKKIASTKKENIQKFSVEKIMESTIEEYKRLYFNDWSERVRAIPVFLDAAYSLYIRQRSDAPFCKFPMTYLKFRLVDSLLPNPRNKVHEVFHKLYDNSFLLEVRQEEPPFALTTELTSVEIQEKIDSLVPIFKSLVENLIKSN